MNGSLTLDFSKVEFHDIPEAYGIAEPVSFRYTIASSLVPSPSDWIGLYRVGWKSTKEYVTYEWICLPDNYTPGTRVESVCTFKDKLPKNDEDFFQFCYINSQSKACGASSPFQFLEEDYDIVVINETDSMLILETKPGLARLLTTPAAAAADQHQEPCTDEQQTVTKEDEVERLTAELTETKKHLMEKDSQLEDLESEVNQLRSTLTESEKMSGQLAEDVDRLKSELLDEKEKRTLVEKSFHEIEKSHEIALSDFSDRELTYQEKEMQLNVTVLDLQKQLCQKAQELELLQMDHLSSLSVLGVKQSTVEQLTKRCSKLSSEVSQMKKVHENISTLQNLWKEKEALYRKQIKHLQTASDREKRMSPTVVEKQTEFHGRTANDVTVTDGVETMTGATAEGGQIQKGSSVNTLDRDLSSADRRGGIGDTSSEKTCRVCRLTFPQGTSFQVIRDHLQSHEKVCPMCDKHFELSCTQQEFETHVSEHLVDTMKRADGRKICPMCDLEFPPAWAQEQFEIHVNAHFGDSLESF